MPNNVHDIVDRIVYAPTSESAVALDQQTKLYHSRDTIAQIQEQARAKQRAHDIIAEIQKGVKVHQENAAHERTQLPPPKSKLPIDDMLFLAEAFGEAFASMSKGVRSEATDYSALQQYNETQSSAVLQSSTNAITKEKNVDSLQADISDFEAKTSSANDVLSKIMLGIGIGVTVITIVSGIVDGFVSLAALPAELDELSAEGSAVAGDSLLGDGDDIDLAAADDEPATDDASLSDLEDDSSSERAELDTNKELEESSAAAGKGKKSEWQMFKADMKKNWKPFKEDLKVAGKYFMKFVISTGFSAPLGVKGVTGIILSNKLAALSAAQSDVGNALGIQQSNNMIFQFLQQIIQREGGVAMQEVDNTSEIIDTFSTAMNAYRSVPFGLANAV
jgi:hypothetical protein